uniref:Reverse transcriptase domain-containing protein n=1 Tax=Tanacetum cinerariifolium TaxID=118510 RepID=A0A6L2L5I0_TANCI|nr:reverse transcriptase domain-containing protein [Tanacetum cinerariifolium]
MNPEHHQASPGRSPNEAAMAKFQSDFSQQKRFTKTHLAVHGIKQEKARVSELLLLAINLVEHLSIVLPSTYKGLMEKTYTWIEAREVSTNGAPNDHKDNFERRYHQILIAKKDEMKTDFYPREGVFCYKRLPFGLKNAREIYQRLIDKVFNCQVGQNTEVNADEMVIKSDSEEEMLANIKETEADEAFRRMKEILEALPTMTAPVNGETLIVYLAASEESISVVLMAERGKKKVPVYFVSRTLDGAELEYPKLVKLILALILVRPEKSGRLMLVNPEEKEYLRFEFETNNNKAEYEALLEGLHIAKEMKIQELIIFVDSQLVASQVNGLFKARQPVIKQYLEKAKELLVSFPTNSREHIKRDQNKKADALSKLASMTFSKLAKEVLV